MAGNIDPHFIAAIADVVRAMRKVENHWSEAYGENPIGYPFHLSLDEMVSAVETWHDAVKKLVSDQSNREIFGSVFYSSSVASPFYDVTVNWDDDGVNPHWKAIASDWNGQRPKLGDRCKAYIQDQFVRPVRSGG